MNAIPIMRQGFSKPQQKLILLKLKSFTVVTLFGLVDQSLTTLNPAQVIIGFGAAKVVYCTALYRLQTSPSGGGKILVKLQFFQRGKAVAVRHGKGTKKSLQRGPHQVQVDRRLLTYIPYSVSQKRTAKWTVIKSLAGGGTVTATAAETITSTDILIFLGLLKLCQDRPDLIHISKIDYGLGEEVKDQLLAVALPEWQMCKMVGGDHNLVDFKSSIERLADYRITWRFPDGDQIMTRLVWTSIFQGGMASVVVGANMLDFMSTNGWLVYLGRVRKLRGNIARALALYLSQQHSRVLRQDTLTNLLWGEGNAPDPVTCRKLILKAGEEIVNAKVVSSFSARKTTTGWVFDIGNSP